MLRWRPHLPRRTLRLRLTLLYGGLFLVSGTLLLAITYAVVAGRTSVVAHASGSSGVRPELIGPGGVTVAPSSSGSVVVASLPSLQRGSDLHTLLIGSAIALAIMATASMWIGWVVAGRLLRPLRTVTSAAREISATNLHERLSLQGPNDELKELGDTFDGLLGRLEAAFESQRRFVANASHELRTPLARLKTVAQVATADPHATVESLRSAHETVLASELELEQLIDALLTLASGEQGLRRRDLFDLAVISEHALRARAGEIERSGIRLTSAFGAAPALGVPQLAERLVANLIDNAIRHNVPQGWIEVETGMVDRRAAIRVSNGGEVISPEDVARLSQPFQRLGTERISHGGGHGLGLSIVHAVAGAHRATVRTHARDEGGLEVEVLFPVAEPADGS